MSREQQTGRLPIIATIIVAAAVAAMIGLGIWQLQRKGEKEAAIAQYEAARDLPAISWPSVPMPDELPLFRKSSVNCIEVVGWQSVSGTSQRGAAGIKHIAECRTGGGEGPGAMVALGWSNRLDDPAWTGGEVSGVIVPDREYMIRLLVTEEVPGLQKLKPPTTDSIPNNHLMYAVQWFFFALTALVIYVIALRRRMRATA